MVASFYNPARVTSDFGDTEGRTNPHGGVDFGYGPGTAVPSFVNGTVVKVETWGSTGGTIVIQIADGPRAGMYALYYHLNNRNFAVSVGQYVSIGQTVGYIAGWNDSHGTAWTGPHIHIAVGSNPNGGGYVNTWSQINYATSGDYSNDASDYNTYQGWVIGTTAYKGGYGEQNFNGAKFYVVEPYTDDSKSISAITSRYGITLEQAWDWTNKVANSQYASIQGEGGGWWSDTGNPNKYYAGNRVALNDIVSVLDAYYEAEKKKAEEEAEKKANKAIKAIEAERAKLADTIAEETNKEEEVKNSVIKEQIKEEAEVKVISLEEKIKNLSDLVNQKTNEAMENPDIAKAVQEVRTQSIKDANDVPVKATFFETIKSKEFWSDTLSRGVNTFLQTGLAVIGTGAIGITEINYIAAANLGASAAMISLVMSFIRATSKD